MRWAAIHGSDKWDVAKEVIYFVFAYEFGWEPSQVDRLTTHQLESLLTILGKIREERSREMDKLEKHG